MPEVRLIDLIEDAMDRHGAQGLYNSDGPCGCGRGDLSPGDCLNTGCTLAVSKIATEDEVDDCIEVGDVVWFPIQIGPVGTSPRSIPPPPLPPANIEVREDKPWNDGKATA